MKDYKKECIMLLEKLITKKSLYFYWLTNFNNAISYCELYKRLIKVSNY